jgi:hypothetical protein
MLLGMYWDLVLYFLLSFVSLLSIAYLPSFYVTLAISVISLLFFCFFVTVRFRDCCTKAVASIFTLVSLISSAFVFNVNLGLFNIFFLALIVWLTSFYIRKYLDFWRFILSFLVALFLMVIFNFKLFEISKVFLISAFGLSASWIFLEMLFEASVLKRVWFRYSAFLNIFSLLFSLLVSVGIIFFLVRESYLTLFVISAFSLLVPFGILAYDILLVGLPFLLVFVGIIGGLISWFFGRSDLFLGSSVFTIVSFIGWLLLLIFYDFVASPLKVMRDIQNFKLKLSLGSFGGLNDIIKVFNDSSSAIKLFLIEEKQLPLSLLTKLVASDRVLFNDVSDKEYISRFLSSNRIVGVFRVSDVAFETFYLIIKKIRGPIWVLEEERELLEELVNLVSSSSLSAFSQAFDDERESFVREIEAFDRVKEFLIRGAYLYFFKNRVIAYKFIEDLTAFKGYYFDIFFDLNRLFAFLMHIPDRLLLSSFALLALKGLIKTFPMSDITHDRLELSARNFIANNDLPLNFFMSSVELVDNVVNLRLSENVHCYVVDFEGGDFAVRYISGKATIKDFVAVFLATRDISEFFDRFLPILSKDISKDDKAKEMLNLVNEYDTFVMVVL